MSYSSLDELPEQIRRELSEAAQEVYRAAYNETYAEERAHDNDEDAAALAQAAHDAAMLRVRQQFSQDADGRWQADPIGDHMHPDKPAE